MQNDFHDQYFSSSLLKTTFGSYQSDDSSIDPEFFGSPNFIDFIKDIEFCKNLRIDIKGKPRAQIKAEILSKLTGKTLQEMYNFYNSKGVTDKKKDNKLLKKMGLIATDSREMNKAIIINALIELKRPS